MKPRVKKQNVRNSSSRLTALAPVKKDCPEQVGACCRFFILTVHFFGINPNPDP